MLTVAVTYPGNEGTRFDHAYYRDTHMPLVRRLWGPMGLQGDQVMRGQPGPDGKAPGTVTMTLLSFASMDNFKAASDQHGAEIFGDIPKFYDGSPSLGFFEAAP